MTEPMISVIIPTLDCGDKLNDALDSFCSQTRCNFEIIIVDGGSSDGTIYFAQNHPISRKISITIIKKFGSSIYGAMNAGAKLASGKWLLFFGADDQLYDSLVFADIFPLLESTSEAVVYGEAFSQKLGGVRGGSAYDNYSLSRWTICHQAIFYRSHLFNELSYSYDEKFPVEADWDLNLKLWARFKFRYTNRIICMSGDNGISSRFTHTPFLDVRDSRILTYFGWKALSFLPPYRLKSAIISNSAFVYLPFYYLLRLCDTVSSIMKKISPHPNP